MPISIDCNQGLSEILISRQYIWLLKFYKRKKQKRCREHQSNIDDGNSCDTHDCYAIDTLSIVYYIMYASCPVCFVVVNALSRNVPILQSIGLLLFFSDVDWQPIMRFTFIWRLNDDMDTIANDTFSILIFSRKPKATHTFSNTINMITLYNDGVYSLSIDHVYTWRYHYYENNM